jgi:hypothetical protein
MSVLRAVNDIAVKETQAMKLRFTVVATVLSALAVSPLLAGSANACDYGKQWKSTSAEPGAPSEAAKKLASLNLPATGQESTVGGGAGASQGAETTTSQ